jgi:hypothetical protein
MILQGILFVFYAAVVPLQRLKGFFQVRMHNRFLRISTGQEPEGNFLQKGLTFIWNRNTSIASAKESLMYVVRCDLLAVYAPMLRSRLS